MTPAPEPDLATLRRQMDALDDRLLALVADRLALAETMGRIKRRAGVIGPDPAREDEIVGRLTSVGPVESTSIAEIWRALFAASRRVQERIG